MMVTGMMEKANFYYKLFFQWMNENMREHRPDTYAMSSFLSFSGAWHSSIFLSTIQTIQTMHAYRSAFSFKHVKPLEKGMETKAGPMVIFATPGMLHAGLFIRVECFVRSIKKLN
jgi:hypothetical protein